MVFSWLCSNLLFTTEKPIRERSWIAVVAAKHLASCSYRTTALLWELPIDKRRRTYTSRHKVDVLFILDLGAHVQESVAYSTPVMGLAERMKTSFDLRNASFIDSAL